MNYEDLLVEASSLGAIVKEKPLKATDGLMYGNRIAIRNGIRTERQKACVLAEEIGHYKTTSGNILNQGDTGNRKQELRAREDAYDTMIGLDGIIECYRYGCRSLYDMAQHLEVTDSFLINALKRYADKYGISVEHKGYVISFVPHLSVLYMGDKGDGDKKGV